MGRHWRQLRQHLQTPHAVRSAHPLAYNPNPSLTSRRLSQSARVAGREDVADSDKYDNNLKRVEHQAQSLTLNPQPSTLNPNLTEIHRRSYRRVDFDTIGERCLR